MPQVQESPPPPAGAWAESICESSLGVCACKPQQNKISAEAITCVRTRVFIASCLRRSGVNRSIKGCVDPVKLLQLCECQEQWSRSAAVFRSLPQSRRAIQCCELNRDGH